MSDVVLSVQNLETTFETQRGPIRVVNDISYEIYKGQTLGIVGESGCGKSVTSLSIMGLVEPPGRISGGRIILNNRDLTKLSETEMEKVRGKEAAIIFQEPMTALNPVLTIGAQIDEQILRHQTRNKKEARDRTIEILHLVGIASPEERYKSYPHQLSGGMRQRAMIAMALSCSPSLLIADEPTTALDVTIQAQILELLQDLQKKLKMTVQFITHDLGVLSEIADRALVMYGGQICEISSTYELFSSPKHPYTAALIESRPHPGERKERLKTIEGHVPMAADLPPGCPFQNRCPRAKMECRELRPPLLTTGRADHQVACFNPL